MSPVKIAAIVLIVAGVLGLAYGSFSYTKETHDAKVGPIELSVKRQGDRQRSSVGWPGGDRDWRRDPPSSRQDALAPSASAPAQVSCFRDCRGTWRPASQYTRCTGL